MTPFNKIIIGDTDSLVALANSQDANHEKARDIAGKLAEKSYTVIYPNTAILETITVLKRRLNLTDRAELIAKQALAGAFTIIWVDEEIQIKATKLFIDKASSKKNTIFDCIVAVCAQSNSADGIFSFDSWYPKLGLSLTDYVLGAYN